jgi:hypothetical protein
MHAQANPCSCTVEPALGRSVATSLADLLAGLAAHEDKALVFVRDGRAVLPGYHVTEVKAGTFSSLDCGANPESWRETIIQLWDVPGEAGGSHMRVAKFLAIMRKVAAQVAFDRNAQLTFEISDGVGAMQIFSVSGIAIDGETLRVTLRPRPASCKPRDRWLDQNGAVPLAAQREAVSAPACCN